MELEYGIKKILEDLIESKIIFEVQEEGEKKIKVIVGYLPPEKLESIVPCIAIRNIKGKNTLDEKRIVIRVIIGLYGKDTEKGYGNLRELIKKIGYEITKLGIISEEYEVLPEYEWEINEEQLYPYFLGNIDFNILEKKDYREDFEQYL